MHEDRVNEVPLFRIKLYGRNARSYALTQPSCIINYEPVSYTAIVIIRIPLGGLPWPILNRKLRENSSLP